MDAVYNEHLMDHILYFVKSRADFQKYISQLYLIAFSFVRAALTNTYICL